MTTHTQRMRAILARLALPRALSGLSGNAALSRCVKAESPRLHGWGPGDAARETHGTRVRAKSAHLEAE